MITETTKDITPNIVELIQSIIDLNPGYATVEGIVDRIHNHGSILTLISDDSGDLKAIVVADIITVDTGMKVLVVPHVAGSDVRSWYDTMVESMHELARANNCQTILASGRRGWEKLGKASGGSVIQSTIEWTL